MTYHVKDFQADPGPEMKICSQCWLKSYSSQLIDGKRVPYKAQMTPHGPCSTPETREKLKGQLKSLIT